ncbi:2-dehydropantoate 2-reductase [Actinomadura decatromicini]|uniref:2-dehydropantoate 2-reductase n=1 Tax=Actinomadura decatromicini TaxID=2604572 RepID=A0A5D3F9P0_9ACTN|nr:2-dehydropantoate 2-reductase [Actinomadura decatromicini]TYK44624.1 2-dehydropantoate 2-reductase [Actinomadura decatromicini]
MRICVFGLGAVGGLIAARLARSGVPVAGVARGATLGAIRERGGLVLAEGPDGEPSAPIPLTVTGDPAELGPQDVVIVAVKATALPSAAPAIARVVGPDTAIVPAMNGLPWWFFHGLGHDIRLESTDPDGTLSRLLPAGQVVGAVLHLAASCPEPGVVRRPAGERIILGDPAGGSARAEPVAAALRGAGFEVETADRIQRAVWYKLWGNMTMNPLSVITGATMDRILDDPLARGFATACMREAAEVGARIGLPIDTDPEERHTVSRGLGAVRTSMLQDAEAGRPVELDALVAAVTELGRAVGVPTPSVDALFGLARLNARVRGLYPDE